MRVSPSPQIIGNKLKTNTAFQTQFSLSFHIGVCHIVLRIPAALCEFLFLFISQHRMSIIKSLAIVFMTLMTILRQSDAFSYIPVGRSRIIVHNESGGTITVSIPRCGPGNPKTFWIKPGEKEVWKRDNGCTVNILFNEYSTPVTIRHHVELLASTLEGTFTVEADGRIRGGTRAIGFFNSFYGR